MSKTQTRPKLLYISCAENGFFGLRALLAQGYDVAGVVTIPPQLGVKYAVSGYCDFAPYCAEIGLPLVALESYAIRPQDLIGLKFDLIIVNGWNRLIPLEVIQMAPMGGLGVHAGHPPIGLGRAPLVWNILLGHSDIEVYIFRLTSSADDGSIIVQRVVEITNYDHVKHLYEKVMLAAAGLFPEAVDLLCQGYEGYEQEKKSARLYEKRGPEDGLIDFCTTEQDIYNFVRAQSPPYPGAFAWLDDARWSILSVQPFDRFAFRGVPRQPGTILCALPSGLVVQTGGAPIWITRAVVEGIEMVPASLPVLESFVGKRFVSQSVI